ncbi:MAG: hypothetical protein M1814_005501 [Vezdaea aestivalis]|nr:MAG: hypothetical protein M1814_005501 [Vezdaea aestivalis]
MPFAQLAAGRQKRPAQSSPFRNAFVTLQKPSAFKRLKGMIIGQPTRSCINYTKTPIEYESDEAIEIEFQKLVRLGKENTSSRKHAVAHYFTPHKPSSLALKNSQLYASGSSFDSNLDWYYTHSHKSSSPKVNNFESNNARADIKPTLSFHGEPLSHFGEGYLADDEFIPGTITPLWADLPQSDHQPTSTPSVRSEHSQLQEQSLTLEEKIGSSEQIYSNVDDSKDAEAEKLYILPRTTYVPDLSHFNPKDRESFVASIHNTSLNSSDRSVTQVSEQNVVPAEDDCPALDASALDSTPIPSIRKKLNTSRYNFWGNLDSPVKLPTLKKSNDSNRASLTQNLNSQGELHLTETDQFTAEIKSSEGLQTSDEEQSPVEQLLFLPSTQYVPHLNVAICASQDFVRQERTPPHLFVAPPFSPLTPPGQSSLRSPDEDVKSGQDTETEASTDSFALVEALPPREAEANPTPTSEHYACEVMPVGHQTSEQPPSSLSVQPRRLHSIYERRMRRRAPYQSLGSVTDKPRRYDTFAAYEKVRKDQIQEHTWRRRFSPTSVSLLEIDKASSALHFRIATPRPGFVCFHADQVDHCFSPFVDPSLKPTRLFSNKKVEEIELVEIPSTTSGTESAAEALTKVETEHIKKALDGPQVEFVTFGSAETQSGAAHTRKVNRTFEEIPRESAVDPHIRAIYQAFCDERPAIPDPSLLLDQVPDPIPGTTIEVIKPENMLRERPSEEFRHIQKALAPGTPMRASYWTQNIDQVLARFDGFKSTTQIKHPVLTINRRSMCLSGVRNPYVQPLDSICSKFRSTFNARWSQLEGDKGGLERLLNSTNQYLGKESWQSDSFCPTGDEATKLVTMTIRIQRMMDANAYLQKHVSAPSNSSSPQVGFGPLPESTYGAGDANASREKFKDSGVSQWSQFPDSWAFGFCAFDAY